MWFVVGTIGLEWEWLSPREGVGLAGPGSCALSGGVEGKGGVYVGVTEERLPERIEVRAGFSRFGAFEAAGRRREQERQDEACRVSHR